MSRWDYTAPPGSFVYARPAVRAPGSVTTSAREVANLLIAAVVLTVDIALISLRSFPLSGFGGVGVGDVLVALAFGAAAALTGFVFHELAHKIAAERRGYWAEFRMSTFGLLFSFLTAFIGFLFAAPGATMVQDMADPRDWGRTGLAGPSVNLVEGGAFFAVAVGLVESNVLAAAVPYLLLLAFFNGWFATFNLIPVGPLDGRKVLHWSVPVWAGAFALSAALAGVMFALFFGYLSL